LEFDIKFYLEDLIKLLLSYIENNTFSRDVRNWALTALGNTILIAEKKIEPYLTGLLECCHKIILDQGSVNEEQIIKGQALLCAGRLISSCGKEKTP